MLLSQYQPELFNQLASLEGVHADVDCLNELAHVIVTYGLQDQVALRALHKHFVVAKDERVVEYAEGDAFVSKPTRDATEQNSIAHTWSCAYDARSGNYLWYPLEFFWRDADKARTASVESVMANTAFLSAFATVIERHQATEMIGLQILRTDETQRIEQAPEAKRVLYEETDTITRTSRVERASSSFIAERHTEVALWVVAHNKLVGLLHCTASECSSPSEDENLHWGQSWSLVGLLHCTASECSSPSEDENLHWGQSWSE